MTDLLAQSDRILRGETAIEDQHPFRPSNTLGEVGDRTAFVESFANVSAFATDDGLVLVDTGSAFAAPAVHAAVRGWTTGTLHTAIYTHGHIDHVFGTAAFEAEVAEGGGRPVEVIAHEDVDPRFDRYCETAGYNAVINQRQFQAPGLTWPTEYRRPDRTYRDRLDVEVGGLDLQLHHARGETDDATWVWVPERRTVCTGDLIIWCTPNAGNPQKVQRYAADWARALREMAALDPEVLLPGHGLPVRGTEQVQRGPDRHRHGARVPARPDPRPDERGGPPRRHHPRGPGARRPAGQALPPPDLRRPRVRGAGRVAPVRRLVRREPVAPQAGAGRRRGRGSCAALAGGPGALARRATELAASGDDADLRLAGHLAEMAVQADPADAGLHRARSEVFATRAAAESSLMAKGVFRWAASESDEGRPRRAGADGWLSASRRAGAAGLRPRRGVDHPLDAEAVGAGAEARRPERRLEAAS